MSCSRTQRSASGEARTGNPSISGQALYHDCAPQLGSILCRYDTCPTQYAPDLRGSILCMQGTQYAPRESILCMEHFVALQCIISYQYFRVFHYFVYNKILQVWCLMVSIPDLCPLSYFNLLLMIYCLLLLPLCVFDPCLASNTFSESHNNYGHSRPTLQHKCCNIRINNVSAQLEPRVTIAMLTIKTLFIDD